MRTKAFWISFLTTLLLAVFLASRVEQLLPGAYTIELLDCQVDFLDTRLQPVFTVALACPGVDYTRLWPLPIQKPWSEERQKPAGQQAGLPGAFLAIIGTELDNNSQQKLTEAF